MAELSKLNFERHQIMYETFLEVSTKVLEQVGRHDWTLTQLMGTLGHASQQGPVSQSVSRLLGLVDAASPKRKPSPDSSVGIKRSKSQE